MQKFLFIVFLGLTLFSCSKDVINNDPAGTPNPVNIRVRNVSGVDFTDVFVSAGSDHNFGDVALGSETDYHLFDYAYRYAYIKLVAGTDTLVMQPIDYVGESYLTPGNYTYILDTMNMDNSVQLTLTCVAD